MLKTNPSMHNTKDLKGEKLIEIFYKKDLLL